jgi:GTP 3',8-cyclase
MLNEFIYKHNRKLHNPKIRDMLQGIYNSYINAKKYLQYGTTDFFDEVLIETTSLCNRKCSYCPVSLHDRGNFCMAKETYSKVIDELGMIGFKGQLGYHFFGEPLLDRRLEDFTAYARKRLPSCHIMVYTNGDLLTMKRIDSLLSHGVSKIYVTLHENKNIDNFLGLYGKVGKAKKSKIVVRHLDENSLLASRGGLIKAASREVRSTCGYPSNSVTIDFHGNVVLCCEDYFSRYRWGNVNQQTLMEIWNKSAYRKVRADTLNGNFALPICANCKSRS